MLLVGCQPASVGLPHSSGKLKVVATTGMVADLVRSIGGEQVEVIQIMRSGIDPHTYSASRDDMRLLLASDVVFYSGLLLEGKLTDRLRQISQQRTVVAVAEEVDTQLLLSVDAGEQQFDPHLWMNIAAWSHGIEVVESALSLKLPEHADQFAANAVAHRAQLQKLDEYARECLASIPSSQRVLVTSHDAFGYFGRAYGLEVQGVQGISTESEAGLQRINQLVDLLVDRQIQAVFVESSVSRKSIQALIDGAAARGHTVAIGGELFSDAMGEDGTYLGTYIGMLDHNVTIVTQALGGKAPGRGLNGRLKQIGPSE
jgi:manganese/zinc/iron transport system substrate-binding protein